MVLKIYNLFTLIDTTVDNLYMTDFSNKSKDSLRIQLISLQYFWLSFFIINQRNCQRVKKKLNFSLNSSQYISLEELLCIALIPIRPVLVSVRRTLMIDYYDIPDYSRTFPLGQFIRTFPQPNSTDIPIT